MAATERIVVIERSLAIAERRIVDAVARIDPSWGSMTFDLADGAAILAGPGLYTNQVMGAGLRQALTDDDLAHLEEHAEDIGVVPAVQTCEATRSDAIERLRRRGYRAEAGRCAVVHDLEHRPVVDHDHSIEFIGVAQVDAWQEASAEGWGHVTPRTRAASDVYARAAAESDTPGLLLARDATGVVVGAAMLRIDGDIATLGGMSTRPEARRRGVQSALIAHRLSWAHDAGCAIAVSTALPGGGSLRNLERLGFRPSHTHTTWERV
ncbi:MAG: GNAT family N-acetyltransferase [Actinomycetota bacterium]